MKAASADVARWAAVDAVAELHERGVGRGDLVALVVAPRTGAALATPAGTALTFAFADVERVVQRVEEALRPRWVMWSNATAVPLVEAGIRVATGWDIAAVHRLAVRRMAGRSGTGVGAPARPRARGDPAAGDRPTCSAVRPIRDGTPDDPVRADGYLRPDWATGGWSTTPERLAAWAELAVRGRGAPAARVWRRCPTRRARRDDRARPSRRPSCCARSCRSTACRWTERSRRRYIGALVGERPRREADAAAQRAQRDAEVLRHAPPGAACDLRSPGQVKSLLGRVGFDLPDTRAWRLEAAARRPIRSSTRSSRWRKAERVATTYGYAWLDENLGADGRLRGAWTGSDGAAGRMTASAGLHNMPADMRAAVVAEPGHVFVRADLGQIEPRVLAAVSGDAALARGHARAPTCTRRSRSSSESTARPRRSPCSARCTGRRPATARGRCAGSRRRIRLRWPTCTRPTAPDSPGRSLRTYGGRLIRMGSLDDDDGLTERDARGRAAARGRYGRNALVQGAAAELFKAWAVTVRARARAELDARIVLCLHDELLVHARVEHGEAVAQLLDDCLQEAAQRWAPDDSVRFVADISVIDRWSDAKDG